MLGILVILAFPLMFLKNIQYPVYCASFVNIVMTTILVYTLLYPANLRP